MSTHIKVNQVVKYGGHNVGSNGSVNLTLKADYSELENTVKLLQLLNNDVSIKAKFPGEKAIAVGEMRIKDIKIDGDGESVLKFNGLADYIEMDNLNQLLSGEAFRVLFESDVEDEQPTSE